MLVKVAEAEKTTAGGIILAESAQRKPTSGTSEPSSLERRLRDLNPVLARVENDAFREFDFARVCAFRARVFSRRPRAPQKRHLVLTRSLTRTSTTSGLQAT